ncbi:LysR family transcriptional regulator [Ligilactobacillus salivarius]|uniref:LysR family transcriptional regulator n=1 Tax=Ligilactobacillus salivarius TaxID=1624 RepID=UPI00321A8A00
MDTKSLEYYHKLVEEKNFSKVAEFFEVSQPTITLAIKRLENEYQTKFFLRDRSHKELILTKDGKQFDRHVVTILNELEIARKEISRNQEQMIRLGLPPIISQFYFPQITPGLTDNKLLRRIEPYEEKGSAILLKMLKDGTLDMSLLSSTTPLTDKNLKAHIISKANFKIIVSPQHRLANRKSVTFNELVNENFINLNSSFIHVEVFKHFAHEAHFRPTIIFQTSDVPLLKSLVSQNTGIALLTDLALKNTDDLVALDIETNIPLNFIVSIAYRRSHILTPNQSKLISLLTDKK